MNLFLTIADYIANECSEPLGELAQICSRIVMASCLLHFRSGCSVMHVFIQISMLFTLGNFSELVVSEPAGNVVIHTTLSVNLMLARRLQLKHFSFYSQIVSTASVSSPPCTEWKWRLLATLTALHKSQMHTAQNVAKKKEFYLLCYESSLAQTSKVFTAHIQW